jgi:hypothetical protein
VQNENRLYVAEVTGIVDSMNEQQFTEELRALVRQRPFVPFVVELVDGGRIVVDYPAVAFADGAAGFLTEADGSVAFMCEQVRAMQ